MPTADKPRRGDDSRRDLKETAIDCFARYGYQGTSIDRIAREAGVTKGAIYYHFKDKNDLLAAAVADRVAEFEARVQKACEGTTPSESLLGVVRVCVEHATSEDRPRFAIKLMVEAIDTHERLREDMQGMMRRFRAFLRNIVRAGQDSGEFRADANADIAAALLTSAVIGAETQYYLDPERFNLGHALESFVARLCNDLRPVHEGRGSTSTQPPEQPTQGRTQP